MCLGASLVSAETSFSAVEKNKLARISEVVIVTKNAPPFSDPDGRGYSMDMLEEIINRLFGSGMTKNLKVMNGTNDVISFLNTTYCSPASNPSRLCIGGAAISITSTRAEIVDYLQSYYQSGFQILTKTRRNYGEILIRMFLEIMLLVVTTVIQVLCILALVAPVAWLCEMSVDEPIFLPPPRDEQTEFKHGDRVRVVNSGPERDRICKVERKTAPDSDSYIVSYKKEQFCYQWDELQLATLNRKRMKQDKKQMYHQARTSLGHAWTWVFGIFTGGNLATPNSRATERLGILVQILHQLMMITLTASATKILLNDASTAIIPKTIEELGARGRMTVVCVTSWSQDFVAKYKKPNHNVKLRVLDKWELMMDHLESETCDAAVYDSPLLADKLSTEQSKGKLQSYGLVGSLLNFDPYGFAMPMDHPLFRVVNRVTIDVARDTDEWKGLQSKYFGTKPMGLVPGDASGVNDFATGVEWFFQSLGDHFFPDDSIYFVITGLLPLSIGIVLYIKFAIIVPKYNTLPGDSTLKRNLTLPPVKKTEREIIAHSQEVTSADIAMTPSEDLIHDIALDLDLIKRLVFRIVKKEELETYYESLENLDLDEGPKNVKLDSERKHGHTASSGSLLSSMGSSVRSMSHRFLDPLEHRPNSKVHEMSSMESDAKDKVSSIEPSDLPKES